MGIQSVNKTLLLINHQLTFHEQISDFLAKAFSLSLIGASEDLSEFSKTILQNYFWNLSDLINNAKNANQEAQKYLLINYDHLNHPLAF